MQREFYFDRSCDTEDDCRKEYRIMDRGRTTFFSNSYYTLDGAKTWFINNNKSEKAFVIVERTIKYSEWYPIQEREAY